MKMNSGPASWLCPLLPGGGLALGSGATESHHSAPFPGCPLSAEYWVRSWMRKAQNIIPARSGRAWKGRGQNAQPKGPRR